MDSQDLHNTISLLEQREREARLSLQAKTQEILDLKKEMANATRQLENEKSDRLKQDIDIQSLVNNI